MKKKRQKVTIEIQNTGDTSIKIDTIIVSSGIANIQYSNDEITKHKKAFITFVFNANNQESTTCVAEIVYNGAYKKKIKFTLSK